jgi:hypothetical protein
VHNEIKRFELTGTVTHDTFVQTRDALIKEVEDSMRDQGYVPVLDLAPQFTREYDAETETFSFQLSIYGISVGEEEAWQTAGVTNGQIVPRYSHPQK